MPSPGLKQETIDSRLASLQSPTLLSPFSSSSFQNNTSSYPQPSQDHIGAIASSSSYNSPRTPVHRSSEFDRTVTPSRPLLSPTLGSPSYVPAPTFDTRSSPLQAGPSRQPYSPSIPRRMFSHPGCVLCGLVASAASLSSALAVEEPLTSVSSSHYLQDSTTVSPIPSPTTSTAFLPAQTSRPASPRPYPQPTNFLGPQGPSRDQISAPRSTSILGGREIVYADDDITVFPASGKERLCSAGRHLLIVLNRHCESVYDLGPADIPMLSHILATAEKLLIPLAPDEVRNGNTGEAERGKATRIRTDVRVGFVGSVMKDPQSPHAHLHAHAMIGPIDTSLPGATFWRRNVVFGGLNWWSIEDLRAEIRESTSNNRVKSGYADREHAPIERVPDAGSIEGLSNALDPSLYDLRDSTMDDMSPSRPDLSSMTSSSSMETVMARDTSVFSAVPLDRKPDTFGTLSTGADIASGSIISRAAGKKRQAAGHDGEIAESGYEIVELAS